jgi:ABC-type transport system involved in cytochrome c biogenesis permease subunit
MSLLFLIVGIFLSLLAASIYVPYRRNQTWTMWQKLLPASAAVLTALFFIYTMKQPRDAENDWAYHAYGRIPVIAEGRFKPMESVARNNLMIITHRQTYYDAKAEIRYPATKWLLDVQTSPLPNDEAMRELFPEGAMRPVAWEHKVFRIENDQLLSILCLERRDGLRYSLKEIVEATKPDPRGGEIRGFDAFFGEVARIKNKDVKQYNLLDAKVAELQQHLQLFLDLATHKVPLSIPDPKGSDQWTIFRDAHEEFGSDLKKLPDTADARSYATLRFLLQSYDAGGNENKRAFNDAVAKHLDRLEKENPERMRLINTEVFFNNFAPFYHSLIVYVLAALIAVVSWVMPSGWTRPVQMTAYAMMAVTFVVHFSGLIFRMYLQDRYFVFVTNLYSSAVFIGLGAVLFCLVLEPIFRNGFAIVVGTVAGFLSLIIAHMLSLSGDTLEMMQAVLDTNFWLATHVTCVTLGYTTTFVAGLMGIAYIAVGLTTNMLRKNGSADFARAIYGVLCAGMFLSFVGTVLGGLWADYSWGRFWGWDPKENGALLIVIWIALILHARWAGLIKHRGLAVLSVLGIIVTSWSWFGTNFLGVGLHSYGFRQGAMMTLVFIDFVFLGIAGIGMIPLNLWQSFRPLSQLAPHANGVARAL